MNHDEALDEAGRIVVGTPSAGYHGSKDYTEVDVAANGLPSDKGNDRHLGLHVAGNPQSAFRGTVMLVAGQGGVVRAACDYAGEGGLVFSIFGVVGWDTTFHAPNACSLQKPKEAEVAIHRQVARNSIDRIADVVSKQRGGATGLFAINWRPLK